MVQTKWYYEELKRCSEEIAGDAETHQEAFLSVAQRMERFSWIAREEGLLGLIDASEKLDAEKEVDACLKSMVELVANGTDIETVEELCACDYFSRRMHGRDGYLYLMQLSGVLAIQAGETLALVQDRMERLLPMPIKEVYHWKRVEAEENLAPQFDRAYIAKICDEAKGWEFDTDGYYLAKFFDEAILRLTDTEMQRLLRDVENGTLAIALQGAHGAAMRHIFDNISDRLAGQLAEDMYSTEPVRAADVTEAMEKIITILHKLMDRAEIRGNGMGDLFQFTLAGEER